MSTGPNEQRANGRLLHLWELQSSVIQKVFSGRSLTWLLLVATLTLAYVISWPLFLLTAVSFLGWAVFRNLGSRFNPLQRVAPVGALVPLTLLVLLSAQFGIQRFWSFIAVVATFVAVLLFQAFTHRCRPITELFPPSVLLTGLIPFASLALSAVIWPGMAFAWVMIGDGYPEFHLMSLYRDLPAGDFFPLHYPFATTGHLLVADSLNISSTYMGIEAFLTDLQAMAAVTFLPIVLAVQQLQLAFGAHLRSTRSLFQGVALGILACSGLVMGLPASNGFISTSFSVLFYSALAVLVTSLFKRFTVAALVASTLLLAVLLSTWQPVAMTGLGLVIAALFYRALRQVERSLMTAAFSAAGVIAVFGLYELHSLVTTGVSGFPGLHGNFFYPMTPVAVFLLMSLVAITVGKRPSIRRATIALSSAAFAGSLGMLVGNRFFDLFDVLAGTFVVNSTPYYYLYKYIWLVYVPVVILAGIAATNALGAARLEARKLVLAATFLIVPFITVTTPSFPWIPKVSQPVIGALGDEFGQDSKSTSARLYYNARGDAQDEAVSNWWLLKQRRYVLSMGSMEWIQAQKTHGIEFPKWGEIRAALSESSSDESITCDEIYSLTMGIPIQDSNDLATAEVETCPTR